MSEDRPVIYAPVFGFLRPLCEAYADFVGSAAEADFVLVMNISGPGADQAIAQARREATAARKPLCWWTIEDPNAFSAFAPQAAAADFVFTSDAACLPLYRRRLGHGRCYWLPLAADPQRHHQVLAQEEGAADCVFSGNWYDFQNEARRWGTETVILPLARAGYSLAVYSYEPPPYEELRGAWRGATSCYTVADQYRAGRLALGQNNQRSGLDGRARTLMTSMRTFEALACGKPLLAPWSEAYEALGFRNGVHLAWSCSPKETLEWAGRLLRDGREAGRMAEAGRQMVAARHTYGHRLRRIWRAVRGNADPEAWD